MESKFSFTNIYIAKDPIDFRKGMGGLAALVQDQFKLSPFDESLFIFTNRSKDRIKCLYYDGTGTWLFYKVLNSGHFDWRITGDGIVSVTSQQMNWLLDGLNMETGKVYKKTTPLFL